MHQITGITYEAFEKRCDKHGSGWLRVFRGNASNPPNPQGRGKPEDLHVLVCIRWECKNRVIESRVIEVI